VTALPVGIRHRLGKISLILGAGAPAEEGVTVWHPIAAGLMKPCRGKWDLTDKGERAARELTKDAKK
jgi:hypothetical protein